MAKVRLRYNMDALRLPPEVARGLKALALTPEQARFFRELTQSPEQARLFRQHLAQSFPDEVDIPPERLVQAVEEATLMSRSEEQDIAGKPPADAPPRGGKKRRRKEPGMWVLIREIAAEKFPDGYTHIRTGEIVKAVGDELEARDLIASRYTIERALGRRN